MIHFIVGKTHNSNCRWQFPDQDTCDRFIAWCVEGDAVDVATGEYFIDGPIDPTKPIIEEATDKLKELNGRLTSVLKLDKQKDIARGSVEIHMELKRLRDTLKKNDLLDLFNGQIHQIFYRLINEGFQLDLKGQDD